MRFMGRRAAMRMRLPLNNPESPSKGSFISRLVRTRKRLRQLKGWAPKEDHSSHRYNATPKVSIMLITFNHERYVSQALDSILMQERDFSIEINVIDDASTDQTQKIVRQYEEAHPGIINCYFNPVNAGHITTQLNTIRGFQTLRGEYFALLEGDDYWTDEKKLTTQVSFLDENKEFVACAHQTMKVFHDGSRPPEHFLPFKAFGRNTATIYDLITMAGVFHLSSIVYRNVFELTPPPCLKDEFSCEVTINMLYGVFGKFYCLDQYMSAYRVHDNGAFSSRKCEDIWLFHLHGFRRFSLYLGPKYWVIFSRAVIGFSRYALSAPAKTKEVASLSIKTKIIFWSHLLVAILVYALTITFNRIYYANFWKRIGQEGVNALLRCLRYTSSIIFRATPVVVIRALLTLESKLPRFQLWRRNMKAKVNGGND